MQRGHYLPLTNLLRIPLTWVQRENAAGSVRYDLSRLVVGMEKVHGHLALGCPGAQRDVEVDASDAVEVVAVEEADLLRRVDLDSGFRVRGEQLGTTPGEHV